MISAGGRQVPIALRSKARGGTLRRLVPAFLFAIAFLILSVSLDRSPPNYERRVSLIDRLIMIFGPAFSANVDIKEPAATIKLKFYGVWDVAGTDGRYLTVATPRGQITRAMCGFDWLHYSETKVYLTPDRKVAVLGPNSCDYLVSLDPLGMMEVNNLPSTGSTYLGAFGLVQRSANPDKFELRFAPASEVNDK
jgi:hypothetical protein